MSKKYEFWCGDCGNHYYYESVRMSYCPNSECDKVVLELSATVDIAEHLDGVMGISPNITSRQIIEKRSLKK